MGEPDLSRLGGVCEAPKLGPRRDKMAAHVSESPTTASLPKGCDDIVDSSLLPLLLPPSFSHSLSVVHHGLWVLSFLQALILNYLTRAGC